ncbi:MULTISPECIES: hypothetical protein [Nocardiopsis]|uniref:hypothetical protein n=1 Tax=Nocardiopsis TaxID=2013 RepID=UPI000344CA7B|nr:MULTISPECIES: hypothetical protein [Nocardiopsis]PWV57398.1 hypothetical protein BDW27_102266 [Nocardiopsis sp. L17-MgMaSL7]
MTGTRGAEVAVDDDGTWCAWTTGSGQVRALGLWGPDSGRIIDLGPGTAVYAGAGTGRFLLRDGGSVRSWSPAAGSRDEGTAPAGALLLEARVPGAGGGRVVAASSEELVLHAGDGTAVSRRLCAPPLVLAWQHRRRTVLCLLSDGTVLRADPVTGSVETSALPGGEDHRLACYEEVLGGVWVVPAHEPGTVRFHRTEADPSAAVYRLDLGAAVDSLRASHSGEWLIARNPGRAPTRLVNVNSGRSFEVPGELAARGAPCVFSFDNQLISVEGDAFESLPVPARADIRSRDGSLDIDTFWSAPPQMHRASRPQRPAPRNTEVGARAGTRS